MKATVITTIAAVLMLLPPVNMVLFLPAMMLLWKPNGSGVPGPGRESSGFFLPGPAGWVLRAVVLWLVLFAVSSRLAHGRSPG